MIFAGPIKRTRRAIFFSFLTFGSPENGSLSPCWQVMGDRNSSTQITEADFIRETLDRFRLLAKMIPYLFRDFASSLNGLGNFHWPMEGKNEKKPLILQLGCARLFTAPCDRSKYASFLLLHFSIPDERNGINHV
ncbi:hypothetical protein CEXT_74151 [Caerostris extrusa]|uniref:Uncharacterized protein n=1 Tax=Caerostris extrusa TaxID=172846 RepID=A0AAV4UWD4_CAEEX|nr:hypothetical protein CEXT_74151 [Caerostris extrusa]